MNHSKTLKDEVEAEAARKTLECEAANSLSENLNHPVEQGLAKASADEARASPYSKPRLPAIKAVEASTRYKKAKYLSPSEILSAPRKADTDGSK